MNPAKHFTSTKRNQHIATFVSELDQNGDPLFGWSRYNYHREKESGVPFSKKEGRKEALKSLEHKIIIDTANGNIQKGEISVHDPEMVRAAVDFIARMKRYYKKAPSNVELHLTIEFLKELAHEVMEENKKLKEENRRLWKAKLQLSLELDYTKNKVNKITTVCTE